MLVWTTSGPYVADKEPAVPLNAGIGLAVPGRPIGPWSRRTGAPEASATRRDRSPRCSRDCSRDGTRHPGMSENRTGRGFGIRPARRPGRDLRAPANTPRRQFRSRCPRTWGFESPRSHTLTFTKCQLKAVLAPCRAGMSGFTEQLRSRVRASLAYPEHLGDERS
jgi:hypothetical protein